jgi:hypothetical protein
MIVKAEEAKQLGQVYGKSLTEVKLALLDAWGDYYQASRILSGEVKPEGDGISAMYQVLVRTGNGLAELVNNTRVDYEVKVESAKALTSLFQLGYQIITD